MLFSALSSSLFVPFVFNLFTRFFMWLRLSIRMLSMNSICCVVDLMWSLSWIWHLKIDDYRTIQFLNFHQEFRSKYIKKSKKNYLKLRRRDAEGTTHFTSTQEACHLCCCRSSQRSVCSSLEMHWAALKQAAFTTHTQTDPVRSINRRRQRLTAQNKQVTLALDCIENPCLWILHESWPKNRQSLSCPGFERSLEKLYRLPHHRIWATLSQSNCRGIW